MPRFIYYLSHLIFALTKMSLQVILAFLPIAIFFVSLASKLHLSYKSFYPSEGYVFLILGLLGLSFIGITVLAFTLFCKGIFVILSSFGFLTISYIISAFARLYTSVYTSTTAAIFCIFNPMFAFYYFIDLINIMIQFGKVFYRRFTFSCSTFRTAFVFLL